MTKIITAAIIIIVLWGGWELFFYWEKVKNEEEIAKKEANIVIIPEQLPGMPQGMEPSLKAAQNQGAAGLRNWLKAYGRSLQDPRKAWIELDYCQLLSREDIPEAKRVFSDVKTRTPTNSVVWPRLKQLEKTYE
jgi:hypothetical protein